VKHKGRGRRREEKEEEKRRKKRERRRDEEEGEEERASIEHIKRASNMRKVIVLSKFARAESDHGGDVAKAMDVDHLLREIDTHKLRCIFLETH